MKRVYIDPAHRGQHLARRCWPPEDEALSRHCHTVRLETGIKQRAAVRLYEQCGYDLRRRLPRTLTIRSACLWRRRWLKTFV
jgi:putative acetyltransferase